MFPFVYYLAVPGDEHWNGKTWSVQPNPSPVLDPPPDPKLFTPDVRLFAVTALSGTSAWAVGWSGNYQTGGSKTLIFSSTIVGSVNTNRVGLTLGLGCPSRRSRPRQCP